MSLVMSIFNKHAPLKQKYVRANDAPFINKELRKQHMKRSRLRKYYLKHKTDESHCAYKKQRNICVSLLRETKKQYYENLNPAVLSDNKKFWKTIKPVFTERSVSTENNTLIEGEEIINNDQEIAETFNDFFSSVVQNMNIEPWM